MKHIKTPITLELCLCGCGMYRIIDPDHALVGMTAIEDSKEKATEIVQAVNAHDALLAACKFWLGAVQNSLALRLALTGLPENAGPALVEMLQEAIEKAESTKIAEAGQ